MEYTKEELEEKFGVNIEFSGSIYATSEYDLETDTIVIYRYLSGKPRLVVFAHELGHKLHIDDLKRKGLPLTTEGKARIVNECEAWKRGLSIAKELGVVEAYRDHWRGDWFPLPVVQECPFPGDDRVPHASIGKDQEYSFQEWGRLIKEYIKTGKWKGKQFTQEHVS